MSRPPHARIAGIPVRVDSSFIFGALILYLWSGGGTAGLYTVIALAFFVLIHEFGHALTAKRFGATAAVTIGFLGGYADYSSRQPMTRAQTIAISAAGSVVQLIVAIPMLWLVTQWIHSIVTSGTGTRQSIEQALDVYQAVAWAGIFVAVLNLIPALPFDGGHILESLVGGRGDARAHELVRKWSIGVAVVLGGLTLARTAAPDAAWLPRVEQRPVDFFDPSIVSMLGFEGRRIADFLAGESIFIPLLIAMGVWAGGRAVTTMIAPGSRPGAQASPTDVAALLRAVHDAEAAGWRSGIIGAFPHGSEPSPWLVAYAAEVRGDQRTAHDALYALADSRERRWVAPTDRAHPAIAAALERLPAEATGSLAELEARVHSGPVDRLAAIAGERYTTTSDPVNLYLGAAGFAVRGMVPEALVWLERAVALAPSVTLLETLPEFGALRGNPTFESLIATAAQHGS